MFGHKGVLLFTSIVFIVPHLAFAGDYDRILFDQNGKRIDLTTYQAKDPSVALTSKVTTTCAEYPDHPCIKYKVIGDPSVTTPENISAIESAFSLWSSVQLYSKFIDLKYVTNGISSTIPDLKVYEGSVATNSIQFDEFQNPLIEGDFIVSFIPPVDMQFGDKVFSKSFSYVRPDIANLKAETKWAGIFLNPALKPGIDYNLQAVVAFELGRILGLAPSNLLGSAMYPIRSSKSTLATLNGDDMFWISSLYPPTGFSKTVGSISGKILDGKDGAPFKGAIVELLAAEKLADFVKSPDRSMLALSTYSRDEGKFEFKAVPVGKYILIIEPLPVGRVALNLFDSWLQFFTTSTDFETEFYDGAKRESNHEAIFSFTPQAIYYAATLGVVVEQNTTKVTVITNSANTKNETISAEGSSNETLSSVVAGETGDLSKDVQLSPGNDLNAGLIGGCGMIENSSVENFSFLIPLGLIFALFLLLRSRSDQRAKSYRSGFRQF
ncbi:MAG: matrixin family metalloprotease [Deltaproteobacteria bacterium]|nr:matrixin family metalloprotease [Deltaproteobacteria bacterium]